MEEGDYLVYDDRYSTSLEDLIKNNTTKSVDDFKALLDANGYMGRYEVYNRYKGCVRTGEVRLVVYMPDSRCSYNWPLSGGYNPVTQTITYGKVRKTVDNLVYSIITKGLYYRSANVEYLAYLTDIPKSVIYKIVDVLECTGVIRVGKFTIVEVDVKEFIDNNLKIK